MKPALHLPIARPVWSWACGFALTAAMAMAGCSDDGPAIDAGPEIDAPPEVGTLSLSWSIEDPDGNPLGCDQVGALRVGVVATPADGGFATPLSFACGDLAGTSTPVDSGTYDVQVDLVASGDRELAPPESMMDVEVATGQNADLGTFTFQVVPRGGVQFVIDAQQAGGNCETEANGGAEIAEFLIEVLDADGTCVPATLTIGDGANQTGGTYNTDCAGARYGCIDKDQTVSISDLASGGAGLNITGYRGPDACFTRNPQFSVPGANLVTELIPQALTANCLTP